MAFESEKTTTLKPQGIIIPRPYEQDALRWMTDTLTHKEITFIAENTNRHNEYLATPYYPCDDVSCSVQEGLLSQGLAVTFSKNQPVPSTWKNAESDARHAKLGFWGSSNYLDDINKLHHQPKDVFYVIEGTVTNDYQGRTQFFLHFGEDWKTDASVTILQNNPAVTANLVGKTIRARGWLGEYYGPILRVSSSNHIEIVTKH